jgi:iron complex outermembrane receptor protein
LVNYKKQIAKHFFQVNSSYAYTISENEKTSKQLTYVPFHKFTAGLAYNFKKLNFNYQYLFNGFVYTQSDHEAFIKSYNVSNLALAFDFGKENKYKLGFQTQNLFNENYQSVAYRPLPGRNYLVNLTLKL